MADQSHVVVTGAGGQVGKALQAVLPGLRYLTRGQLDVTDRRATADALREATCVVHLAAMTHVDRCQREPDEAWAANHVGTLNVCAAAPPGARVIYLSSDYVFDGDKEGAYEEDDAPHPINVYGETKLAGEREVLRRPDGLVIRTSWVYGEGANFLRTILAAARSGKRLRVVADQVGRPTSADSLAAALGHVLDRPTAGVLHVAGDGEPATWADLAETALQDAGLPAEVEHITGAEYAAPAPRPANSTLSLARARRLGVPLRDWRGEVSRFVRSQP
jgi:dTDP-4-dehydrorhamnose reductase